MLLTKSLTLTNTILSCREFGGNQFIDCAPLVACTHCMYNTADGNAFFAYLTDMEQKPQIQFVRESAFIPSGFVVNLVAVSVCINSTVPSSSIAHHHTGRIVYFLFDTLHFDCRMEIVADLIYHLWKRKVYK